MLAKKINRPHLTNSCDSTKKEDCAPPSNDKDIAWFSSATRNTEMSKYEIETVLRSLEAYCEQIEAQKAEIDAELQLLDAYKKLLEEGKNNKYFYPK